MKPPGAADSDDSASQNWGNPVRVRIVGENHEVETTFLVGLKGAWWTDYGYSGDKKTFLVVYDYKNLGPREGSFSLTRNNKVEIKTDKAHIYSGRDFAGGYRIFAAMPEPPAQPGASRSQSRETKKIGVGGWLPIETTKIDENGESAVVFEIPKDEIPTELITSGSFDLAVRLPPGRFGFRRYSEVFGFLPSKGETAVPGLVEALQGQNQNIRIAALDALGGIGAAAKEVVPAITNVLLDDKEHGDVCIAAVRALGRIGPAASESIPTLNQFRQRSPLLQGLAFVGLRRAIYEALENIGSAKDATVAITEDLRSGEITC